MFSYSFDSNFTAMQSTQNVERHSLNYGSQNTSPPNNFFN